MKSKVTLFGVIGAGLALTGGVLRPLETRLWAEARAVSGVGRMESIVAAAGRGLTLGVLGGFRAIAADFSWVRVYMIWEKHDLPAVETLTHLVTTLDPRPVYFWLNSARILAYDMPAWRIAAAGGTGRVPEADQQRIDAEQARLAIRRLDEAAVFHGASPDLWVERANIELTRLRDPAAAAVSYRRAWELRGPYYAARLHAEMLKRIGRKAEALEWLVKLHPQLPRDEEAAAADLVLARIRELERDLGVEPLRAYRPAGR
ncbi:MAG: hypothetical protein HZA93_10715 [Verrucomicrobia bacterium]|nr:hypothetical protein [Verrucomicrobiota bacterium]